MDTDSFIVYMKAKEFTSNNKLERPLTKEKDEKLIG